MKKLAILLFFITASVVAQKKEKIDRVQLYNYSENLEFTIYKIGRTRMTDRGNVSYIAEKGKRFISMMFQFKNNSSEKQIIDFSNIQLVDKDQNLIKIDMVVKSLKLTSKLNRFEQSLKGNKKRIFAVEFEIPIDKKEKISALKVKDKIIELVYK